MMKYGCTVKGSKGFMAIEKHNVALVFYTIIKTQRGQLFCANMQRNATFDVSKDVAHKL